MEQDSREIRTMRCMAWSRAKGELDSMLHTYWGEEARFEEMERLIKEFVQTVEMNGAHE